MAGPIDTRQEATPAVGVERRLLFLAEAATILNSSLDYETTLASLARLVVPHFADWCAIATVADDGAIRQLAVAHVDPDKVQWARELEQRYPTDPNDAHGVPHVLHTGESVLVSEISDSLLEASARDPEYLEIIRRVGMTSVMIVPLTAREHVLGAITFVSAESGRRFEATDLALAEDFARRAALSVDNARLYRAAQEAVRARDAALAQMADERDRLRQVLDVLPEAIVIADAQGRCILDNAIAREITGAAIVGQPMAIADQQAYDTFSIRRLDGSPFPVGELPLQRALQHGEVVRAEQLLMRNASNRRDIPVLISSAPLRDSSGTIMGSVAAFQDISAIKDLERARDEFLSCVSHDLKSPLAAAKGLAQLAQRQLARPDPVDRARLGEKLDGIVTAMTKMLTMINELLDVARLQKDSVLDLDRRSVDLVPLVRQVVAHQQATAGQAIHVDAGVPALIGAYDAFRLERVIANVISNALKYSDADSTVSVCLTRDDDATGSWAVIAVRDEGIGIPAADLPHIFERFHRGRNVIGKAEGTGIGLASARAIVTLHGGAIDVQSAEGAGTTLTVRLPLAT